MSSQILPKVDPIPFINCNGALHAYILGLLWSDGYIHKKHPTIVFSTTVPDAEYFEDVFLCSGLWAIYRFKDLKHPTWKERSTIYTSNRILHDFLRLNGYTSKSSIGATSILSTIFSLFPINLISTHLFINWINYLLRVF